MPVPKPIRLNLKLRLVVWAFAFTQAGACLAASANYFQQGVAAYNSGNYTLASANLKIAVTASPNDALAHYYLANTYLQLKEPPAMAYSEYTKCLHLSPEGQLHQYSVNALVKLEDTYPQFRIPTNIANPYAQILEHVRNRSDDSYNSYDNPLRAEADAYHKQAQDARVQQAAATNPALLKTVNRIQTQSDIVKQNIDNVGKTAANDYSSGLQFDLQKLERQRDRTLAEMTARGTHYSHHEINAAEVSFAQKIADLQTRIDQESHTHRADASIEIRHFDRDVEDLTNQLTNTKSLPGTPVLQSTGTNLYTRQYADPASTPRKEVAPTELKATPEALTLDTHHVPGKSIYRVAKEPESKKSNMPDAKLNVRGNLLPK
jgi:tetratricopeptide (TPR) repeat protein